MEQARAFLLILCSVSLTGCSDSKTRPADRSGALGEGSRLDSAGPIGPGRERGALPDTGKSTGPDVETGDGVARQAATVAGIAVDRYTWIDSAGRTRSASLRRQGAGNGGYAVELTCDTPEGGGWRTVTLRGTGGGEQGFGYFVAHELYRSFDDGSSGTIAALHGEDDSPLGLAFPVTGSHSAIAAASTVATHTFVTTYPKWGTVAPLADVQGTKMTPRALDQHRKLVLPLTIQWTFEKGKDSPRIDYRLDLGAAQAGQLAFDVRGPYGVLEFADGDEAATLGNVQWGDSAYHFTTQAKTAELLTTLAGWDWSQPIGTSRPYSALLARHSATGVVYELGLLEQRLGGDPGLVYSGYSDNRGKSKATTGNNLLSAGFADWEWPFQSAQYAGLTAAAAATSKKLAWGSSALYGSANTQQYLTPALAKDLTAYPPGGSLVYRVCLVTGVSTFSDGAQVGLTRTAAASASPSCSSASPL
jgi:hypothetical protein